MKNQNPFNNVNSENQQGHVQGQKIGNMQGVQGLPTFYQPYPPFPMYQQPMMAQPQQSNANVVENNNQSFDLVTEGNMKTNTFNFNEVKNISLKMLEVRKQVGYMRKREGELFPYVTSGMVVRTVKEFLDKEGIFYMPNVKNQKLEIKEGEYNGKTGLIYYSSGTVEYTFVDTESGESLTYTFGGVGASEITPEFSIGKMLTYIEKYMLLKVFLVPTDEYDVDIMNQFVNTSTSSNYRTISPNDVDVLLQGIEKVSDLSDKAQRPMSVSDILKTLGLSHGTLSQIPMNNFKTIQDKVSAIYDEFKLMIEENNSSNERTKKEATPKEEVQVTEEVQANGEVQATESKEVVTEEKVKVEKVNETVVENTNNDDNDVPQTESEEEATTETTTEVQPTFNVDTTTSTSEYVVNGEPTSFEFLNIQKNSKILVMKNEKESAKENALLISINQNGNTKNIVVVGEDSMEMVRKMRNGQSFVAIPVRDSMNTGSVYANVSLI